MRSEAQAGAAYNDGLRRLRDRSTALGGSRAALTFLLPFVLGVLRDDGPNVSRWPAYEELPGPDQAAVRVLDAVHHDGDAMISMPKLSELVYAMQRGAEAIAERALERPSSGRLFTPECLERIRSWSDPAEAVVGIVRATTLPEGWPDVPRVERSITDPGFLEWLEGQRDPALWLLLVGHLNYDLPATKRVLGWIAAQPDCPREVAAALFHQIQGDHLVSMLPEAPGVSAYLLLPGVVDLVQRAEAGKLPEAGLALSSIGLPDDPAPFLHDMRRRAVEGAVMPVPEGLFGRPFGPDGVATWYCVHSEHIVAGGF